MSSMRIWLDANLSPDLAPWLATTFAVEARSIIEFGLEGTTDHQILLKCRTD